MGLNVSGTINSLGEQIHQYNFHKYIEEVKPFHLATLDVTQEQLDRAASLADSEAEDVFANPWKSLAVFSSSGDDSFRDMNISTTDDRVFTGAATYFMLFCNNTVWDVNYTVINNSVASVSKTKSNSSTAGIASFPMSELVPFGYVLSETVVLGANALSNSAEDFRRRASRGMAKNYLAPIAAQSSPRPAHLVQSRDSRIVSRIPKAALWLLFTANVLYIILAIFFSCARIDGRVGRCIPTTFKAVNRWFGSTVI
ncbi:hypothetical protein EJ04DRAFT_160100 [Polyplosphaeria fusca]|uniref:Uncharacterized protein n=1 Tax=Polyplosphaeria fusca TaxID=682080 RepID=A0A9P4R4T4_9PLEO|nr:hypothetical protein EJ04DRAFT_160100 [Polyplosphaeria fusca]